MSSKKKVSAITAFMSAASALPIVTLPVSSAAQIMESEFVPAMLPTGGAMGIRTLSYREPGDRMKVSESVIWIKSPIGENWEVAASTLVDIISGASAARVSNASGRPVQIFTGASITDRRTGTDLSVKRKFGDNSIALAHTISDEKDYDSRAGSVNATLDFNERNTTLAIGYGMSRDEVRSVDDPRLDERRKSQELLLGITQILDRNSLVQSNLALTRGSGYLSDPYRTTVSNYRDGLFPPIVLAADSRPDSRRQWAWLTRYKRTLPEQNALVSAEYRYYRDDWGIRAHTLYGSWLQTMSDKWKVEFSLRYYAQNEADFYRAEITARPVPRYTSSDQRLAAFGSLEPSVKVILQLTTGSALDLGVSLYRQQGNWKIGGGSPAFEPLRAVLISAGFVHRF